MIMKKVFFAALSMAFAFTAFTGCKDKTTPAPTAFPVIVAGVTGETEGITEVRASYTSDINFTNPGLLQPGTTAITDNAAFTNNSFSFQFPLTVAAANLKALTQADLVEGITLSASFNGIFAYFQAFKGEEAAGHFAYSATSVAGYLIYSDAAVTLKGESAILEGTQYVADVSLNTGWNTIYIKTEAVAESGEGEDLIPAHQKITVQTTRFEGVTLAWNYVAPTTPEPTPEP